MDPWLCLGGSDADVAAAVAVNDWVVVEEETAAISSQAGANTAPSFALSAPLHKAGMPGTPAGFSDPPAVIAAVVVVDSSSSSPSRRFRNPLRSRTARARLALG